MKRILLGLIAVSMMFMLVACGEKQEIDSSKEDFGESQQGFSNKNDENLTRKDEEEIKNKFIIVKNLPKTYTSIDWDGVTLENVDSPSMLVGKYITYSTISIENPSNNVAISNINKFLESLIHLDDSEYETQLPEDFEYPINTTYKEFYQNEDIIVIEEIGNGFTGTGAGYGDIKYYVFDKQDGHLLELEDISREPKKLIEYVYNAPAISDLENNEVTNWWSLGQNMINLPYEYFENYFEGTWAITNDEFIVSQHGTQSAGMFFTLRYKLSDINDDLHDNLIILSREDKDKILDFGTEKYNRAIEIYSNGLELETNIGMAGEVTGYLITNMDEIKKDLSAEKFEKYIGKRPDEADNFNAIRESEGNYYRIDADRGGDITYITTRLVPVSADDNKYVLNAVSYYLTEYGQRTLTDDDERLFPERPFDYLNRVNNNSEYEKRVDEFTVIKENGVWKIDKFVMPY